MIMKMGTLAVSPEMLLSRSGRMRVSLSTEDDPGDVQVIIRGASRA